MNGDCETAFAVLTMNVIVRYKGNDHIKVCPGKDCRPTCFMINQLNLNLFKQNLQGNKFSAD